MCNDSHIVTTVFLRLKDELFFFQNSPKNLDSSYKRDLDLWEFLEGKIHILANFIGFIKLFIVILETEKTCLIAGNIR